MLTFSRPSAQRALVLASVALLVGTSGCFTAKGPCPLVAPRPLATIAVTPNPATMAINATQQFVATGKDANGVVITILPAPTWSVVAGGGTINSTSGVFTAGAATGTFTNTVKATSGGISGFATVIVTAAGGGALATITVTPNPATMAVNATQQFIATGKDAGGVVVPITPAPTWSVVAAGGTINSGSGLFTAGGVTGTFTNTVKATSGLISGTATVTVSASGGASLLGSAATFAVLGGSTVTNTGSTTTIVGDVGVNPGSALTGLPVGQPTGGSRHVNDAAAVTAQSNLTTAYNDLAGRPCGTNMTSLDLGGRTLAAGVYCFNNSAALTGAVTFDGGGNPNALFIIQVASTLTTASNAAVTLINGANANNVYWQIGSSATVGSGSAFKGNIVALQSVTLNTGANLVGRALARNGAVTLDSNAISLP